MAENNSTQGVAWYVKPTSDTIDFIKSIPVDIWADAKNIEVFDDYVKIKSGGLNMVIPMIDAVGGKKDWDEAIARGAGDVLQDLVVGSALTYGYGLLAAGSSPVGLAAVGVGAVALGITWVTSTTDTSFGAFLEQELIKMKDDKFNGIILDNKNTMPDTLIITDYQHHQTLFIDKNNKYAQIQSDTEMIQDYILKTILDINDIQILNINGQIYDILSDLPPILELLGIPLNEDFRSPLVLDLNNDGITSLNLNQSSVYFDLDNNNFKEQTAWISPNDGLLVFDRNSNGTIDNGSELFGNFTPLLNTDSSFALQTQNDKVLAKDGFEALANLDSDKNGIIDINDSKFINLQIWQDLNLNGISEANELKSLSELEIKSLNLNNFPNLNLLVA